MFQREQKCSRAKFVPNQTKNITKEIGVFTLKLRVFVCVFEISREGGFQKTPMKGNIKCSWMKVPPYSTENREKFKNAA